MWNPLLSTLRWVRVTPLGNPVVPEVYCRVTGSSGPAAASRAVSSSSLTPAPAARKAAHAVSVAGSPGRPATTASPPGPSPSGPSVAGPPTGTASASAGSRTSCRSAGAPARATCRAICGGSVRASGHATTRPRMTHCSTTGVSSCAR